MVIVRCDFFSNYEGEKMKSLETLEEEEQRLK